jgi:hypothetical protein
MLDAEKYSVVSILFTPTIRVAKIIDEISSIRFSSIEREIQIGRCFAPTAHCPHELSPGHPLQLRPAYHSERASQL